MEHMKLYRGTRDIFPHELDHRKLSSGVYGIATYFALTKEDAEFYAQGGLSNCQVIAEYEINPTSMKILEIHSSQWNKINSIIDAKKPQQIDLKLKTDLALNEAELSPIKLVESALKNGYDAIVLKGNIEGREQLILPDNSFIIGVTGFSIKLNTSNLGNSKDQNQVNQFIEALNVHGINVSKENHYLLFHVSVNQLKEISSLLDFLHYTKYKSYLSVDFLKQEIEHYEGDE